MAEGAYRVQCIANRTSGVSEDVAVVDFGFYHVPGTNQSAFAGTGAVTDALGGLTAADATAGGHLMDEIENWMSDTAGKMAARTTWVHIKVKRWDAGSPVPNTPKFERIVSHVGTGNGALAPQTACSITFETALRRRWGRIYFPDPHSTNVNSNGRLSSAAVTSYVTDTRDLFDDLAAFDFYPVVFAQGGQGVSAAHTVTKVKCDDVLDVQRRRRWDAPSSTSESSLL